MVGSISEGVSNPSPGLVSMVLSVILVSVVLQREPVPGILKQMLARIEVID